MNDFDDVVVGGGGGRDSSHQHTFMLVVFPSRMDEVSAVIPRGINFRGGASASISPYASLI